MAVNGSLILWKTKKQPTVALSTCEDEFKALSTASQECLYLTQLLRGIDEQKYAPWKVYEDDQDAIAFAKNPVTDVNMLT